MDWIADVTPGDWLRERIDAQWTSASGMHMVVPRGFPAYARIFHPATRSRPLGRQWPPLPHDAHGREWADFSREQPAIDTERLTWGQTAAAFGTRLHPEAQWSRLVRARDGGSGWQQVRGPDGWEYDAPDEGRMDVEQFAALAGHLAADVAPSHAYAAVWDGYGGLVGYLGDSRGRAAIAFSADATPGSGAGSDDVSAAIQDRHRQMLDAGAHDPFNNVFRKATWQPGVLSDDISRGARLELPNRTYILFAGETAAFADVSWPASAPWVDAGESPQWAQSPNLMWSADHRWVVVSEIDFDSTVVAGSVALIAAICADPAFEALPLPEGADLSWEADEVNA